MIRQELQEHIWIRDNGEVQELSDPEVSLTFRYETVFCKICGKIAKGRIGIPLKLKSGKQMSAIIVGFPDYGRWPNEDLKAWCDPDLVEAYRVISS